MIQRRCRLMHCQVSCSNARHFRTCSGGQSVSMTTRNWYCRSRPRQERRCFLRVFRAVHSAGRTNEQDVTSITRSQPTKPIIDHSTTSAILSYPCIHRIRLSLTKCMLITDVKPIAHSGIKLKWNLVSFQPIIDSIVLFQFYFRMCNVITTWFMVDCVTLNEHNYKLQKTF